MEVVSVSVPFSPNGAKLLRHLAEGMEALPVARSNGATAAPEAPVAAAALRDQDAAPVTDKPKRGRPKGSTKAPKPEDFEPPHEPGEGEGQEDEVEEAEEEDEAATKEAEEFDADEPTDAATLEQVIDACKKHADRHGKEKTYKVLARFGAKKPRDLEPKQFKLALDALKG